MDLSCLLCSTSVYEPDKYSHSTKDEDIITASVGRIKIDKSNDIPPIAVESSCSETSTYASDQQSSTLTNLSSLDTSSWSIKKRSVLVSGHTSPSSLALRRKLPDARHLLHQHTLSIDGTTTSSDYSYSVSSIPATISSSYSNSDLHQKNRNNINMAIACTATSSEPSSNSSRIGVNHGIKNSNQAEKKWKKTSSSLRNNLPTHLPQSNITVFQQFHLDPPPLRIDAWLESSAESYQVRSRRYMTNKIKQPSEPSAFKLLSVDLINTERPIYSGVCAHPGERVQKALNRESKTGIRELPEFIFAVNLCIPAQQIIHAVFYFAADQKCMDEIQQCRTPFGRIMKRFIFGDSDSYRNKTFKLIPRIVEGNYVVRKAVGSKPAILGKKIKQYYVRSDRYFEVIVDIASDPVAKRITKLCLGCIKTIVLDIMFALEGNDESTLPERILGGARIKNLDFNKMDGKRTVDSC